MKSQVLALVLLGGTCLAQSSMPIYQSKSFAFFPDRITEGKYSARAVSPTDIESDYPVEGSSGKPAHWKLAADISKYPQFRSDFLLMDATYNLSLEELQKDIRADGAFMAGAKWEGVWTRDISYSILLSLATIEPDVAKTSLMRKVRRERIVQDTGTGGSWPVSSDRMVWALAAWEIYEVTGDRDWLRQSYTIIRNSVTDDESVAFSAKTGLAHGESSFLDWREQTYPRWMDPVDIYTAQALGTNAVFYRTYQILGQMARSLHEPADGYDQKAERIRHAMNRLLWIESKGYYGQYLYGRASMSPSPRTEALGESLAILFDIAEPAQQQKILRSVPVLDYGIPCIYPQTPGIPPYHNRAIWPFVQAFWNLAAAKQRNGAALLQGLSASYRVPALFLTNKENMAADSGSPVGTAINSDRQLWSVAGNLAMVYRLMFGLSFAEDGLRISPVIPRELGGVRSLSNLHYRGAVLSIRVEGYGAQIRSMTLDGKPLKGPFPGNLSGKHEVVVQMAGDTVVTPSMSLVEDVTAPETPGARLEGRQLSWNAISGAAAYEIYRNGALLATTRTLSFAVPKARGLQEYQVSAKDAKGFPSFLSEPVVEGATPFRVSPVGLAQLHTASEQTSPSTMFVDTSRTVNPNVSFKLSMRKAGRYRFQFRYANGSGPLNTENKCAIRTLFVDGYQIGSIVLPQRGTGAWTNWGMSSALETFLQAGEHEVALRFETTNENMNPDVNRTLIEGLYLLRTVEQR